MQTVNMIQHSTSPLDVVVPPSSSPRLIDVECGPLAPAYLEVGCAPSPRRYRCKVPRRRARSADQECELVPPPRKRREQPACVSCGVPLADPADTSKKKRAPMLQTLAYGSAVWKLASPACAGWGLHYCVHSEDVATADEKDFKQQKGQMWRHIHDECNAANPQKFVG